MTWQQIATTLTDTSSKVAQPIIGDATGSPPGSAS